MEIQNLSQTTSPVLGQPLPSKNQTLLIFIIVIIGLTTGFWISRFSSSEGDATKTSIIDSGQKAVSIDDLKSPQDIKAGVLYGDEAKNFKDHATGTIEKGGINGVGTHILVREGGLSQRASLTSSVVDLDLFIGKNVEVYGETNSSNKTSWLMDVGTIKIIE
ncbi:MAG: hypothetical protein WCV93_04900 [Candidatus Shapirobacteria bacterium]